MNALFADTFYWIALADFAGSAHQRALALVEYLTFFAAAPEQMRRKAALYPTQRPAF